MLDLRFALFAQFPALFLLALIFLVNYLTVRKRSAVKSVLWVLLFGVMLAVSILFCFLGIQAEFWTIKTLFQLSVWSWLGVALVVVFVLLHLVHTAQKKHAKRVMEKELKKAEMQKEEAVAQAREEGKAEARREAAPAQAPADEPSDAEAPAAGADADALPDR
ncbi:MAG: hypothetical protein ACI3VJ_03930 [Hominicoprocola sp.]